MFVLLIVIAASCSCFYFQSLTTKKPEIPNVADDEIKSQLYDPKIHGDLLNPKMSSPSPGFVYEEPQICEPEPLFATTITEIEEDPEPLFATTITEIEEDPEPLFSATITEIEEDPEPLFSATITEIEEELPDEPRINKKTKRIKANAKP